MDDHSRTQHSRPSMAPPPFGYYPQPPSWTAAIFEKHVGKMPSATGYSTAQIDSVFFRLQMEILKLESRQSLDANTMWFRGEVERLRAERDGLLRAGEEAASARLAHQRAQIAHREAQTAHERVERTFRDIVREGNERNAVLGAQLASAQLANEKSKNALEKQICEDRDKYVTSESKVYLLERDIVIINENHQEEKKMLERDLRAVKQERDDLQARCADFESQSSRSITRFVNKKQEIRQRESHIEQEIRRRESHIEHIWSQALHSIMHSTVYDELDINNSVLSTLLRPAISSIDKFAFKERQQFCFAQSYFARSSYTRHFGQISTVNLYNPRFDSDSYNRFDTLVPAGKGPLYLLDLLPLCVGSLCVGDGYGHRLETMIYLERSLLEHTRLRRTSNTAIPLAFEYLLNFTELFDDEFFHSIACVHLAVLGMQYVMHDRAEWFRLVRKIITNVEVTNKPIVNACHAYLALSTHDPTSLMKPELARAFELGRFSASTPIARIVSLTDGSSSATLNGVDIVVTQFYEWEVVFSRATAEQSWTCSLGYMEVNLVEGGRCEMKWGPDAEHQIVFNVSDISNSTLGIYLRTYHKVELATAGMDGISR
ncbi:hypothetical protein KCU67_g692, partial [Aureobasidium melanogenum]